MSRIGLKPISVDDKVKVMISAEALRVEGPLGKLSRSLPGNVEIVQQDGVLNVQRLDDSKKSRATHGLVRSLVSNMIEGVTKGFEKELEIVGIGYRAEVKGEKLILNLGYSHPIALDVPSAIKVRVEGKQNIIKLTSFDKELLGLFAAKIRDLRPPEPYKGKGVRYKNEAVKQKAGKAGAK